MKTYLFFFAMICCLAVKAQPGNQPYLVKSLSGQSISSAKIEASGGSITVTGVNGSEASWKFL